MTRREFIGSTAAVAAVGGAPALPGGSQLVATAHEIRGVLLHWGHNMWGEALPEGVTKANFALDKTGLPGNATLAVQDGCLVLRPRGFMLIIK